MQVNIKRLDPSVPLPEYKTDGAVAFDLGAAMETKVPAHGLALIPTGLVVATPPGFMLMLTARSSAAKKHGLMLANGVGTIDQDYCGPKDELKISVYNFTDQDVVVPQGVAVAQGVFVKIDTAQWHEVKEMTAKTRGGFGSTG